MTATRHLNPSLTIPTVGRYRIDPARSTIRFSTRHLFGLAPVHGTFAVAAGVIDVSEPPDTSLVLVEIDSTSFHTRSRQRDAAVTGPRFLDSARHPTFSFVAESVELGPHGATVPGVLTVCGVRSPVSVRVTGSSDIRSRDVDTGAFAVTATARIDRRQFGVTASRGLAGRHLDLTMEVACHRG